MMKRIISLIISLLLIAGAVCGVLSFGAVAADETPEKVTPADPKALADELMDTISGLQHPYVFYSKDEIPALQEKVKQGLSKKAYELVTTGAQNFMGRTLGMSGGVIGRQTQHFVAYLALYSAISGKEEYAKSAVNLIVNSANLGSVDVYSGVNGALCIGDFGHAYALAYDMLYEYMTDEQRALIKAEMEEIGEWIFVNSPAVNTWGSQEERRKAWNWNAVTHGALGMIAMALGDHEDWLALAIERMEGYYKYAVDTTGAAFEGLHYIGYAFNSWAPLGNAIYRLSGVEVMDAYPQMQQMPYWSMYMNAPHEGEQAKINQGSSMGNYASSFYIINRYKQSDALWGWLHTYRLFGDAKFGAEYQGNGWSAPQIILYEDQSFEPVAPTEENNPLIKTFEKGLVSARDSWDNDAAMMTFTCGYGQSGCWNHPDDNSFTFYAKGESFVIDLGEGKLNSSDHNVLLVDGKGMHFTGGSTMAKGTLQENMILEDGSLYLRGNNLSSYLYTSMKASIRHLVFGGGDTPFVLIFDYARTDGKEHVYSTNFYTADGNKIAIDESGEFATITGTRNKSVCYVIPYSEDGKVSLHKGKTMYNAITTENNATMHLQATLFITANPDGSMPEVEFSSEDKAVTVTLTRPVNGEEKTDSYVFRFDKLVSPGEYVETTETESVEITETETVTETETATVTETESIEVTETEKVTETEVATESETVVETEKITETEKTTNTEKATETQKSEASSGCGSVIVASTIPVIAVGAAVVIAKKKKNN